MRRKPQQPEAMPFQRGRKVPAPRALALVEWIGPSVFNALVAEGTNALRLASSPQIWVERFASDLLLSYKTEAARDELLAEVESRCAASKFQPQRIFGKYLPVSAAERSAPLLLQGPDDLPMETEVEEAGVRYGLDFAAGYSAGLFIDQRLNRALVRRQSPRRLLNTFAYTCSFSVVAALSGAETVSIDLSRRSLTRGETNFNRNKLDPGAGHKFIADDVLSVLPRLGRRGEKFDMIILDPPSFSRNQAGAPFQVQRDFERLVLLALEVASPAARILLSVNHSEMTIGDLERAARSALRLQKRQGRFEPSAALPDIPAGTGAKTVWLELQG